MAQVNSFRKLGTTPSTQSLHPQVECSDRQQLDAALASNATLRDQNSKLIVSLKSMRELVQEMYSRIESMKAGDAAESHFWAGVATPDKLIAET